MGYTEEDLRIEREWTNTDGDRVKIKALSDKELEGAIEYLIRTAVREEYYSRLGPDSYKHSWQTYLKGREYWDCCQVAHRRQALGNMNIKGKEYKDLRTYIDYISKDEYSKVLALKPPVGNKYLKNSKIKSFDLSGSNTKPVKSFQQAVLPWENPDFDLPNEAEDMEMAEETEQDFLL